MNHNIKCDKHGNQSSAIVCVHVRDSLADRKPCGFHWLGSNGQYDAVCNKCAQITAYEWEPQAAALGRVICIKCFADAGRLNNVELPKDVT